MLKKVSVIVPIYNSAAKLSRCVESILSQDYENLEVILVNDGSLDSSLEICEKFKEKDSRIIVINKENFGVSAARNSGLSIASGEFIQFEDKDFYQDSDGNRKDEFKINVKEKGKVNDNTAKMQSTNQLGV